MVNKFKLSMQSVYLDVNVLADINFKVIDWTRTRGYEAIAKAKEGAESDRWRKMKRIGS